MNSPTTNKGVYLAGVHQEAPLHAVPVRQLHGGGQVVAVEGYVQPAGGPAQGVGHQAGGVRPVRLPRTDAVEVDLARP